MEENKQYDVFLIGAGIMSATLGALLKQLQPDLKIGMVERGGTTPQESSSSAGNAGTGHSGFCELNYDLHKAIQTCEAFEKSKQFWSYLVKQEYIKSNFIHQIPHISFVTGQQNVDELKARWMEMKKICLFADMEFTDDIETLKQWMPLVMFRRDRSIPMAATRIKRGTDIDFGILTSNLTTYLTQNGVEASYYKHVEDIKRNGTKWDITFRDRINQQLITVTTKFLFIGAGGMALSLLEKANIPESRGYGGFPVSGEFIMCDNPNIVKQHNAKVYSKPELSSPPMSQAHLDTRIINGKKVLLFGPFAAFTTKFLKNGHWTDFFRSLRFSNILVIISAGLRNLGLSKYLLKEVIKTDDGRFKELLKHYPNASKEDWKLIIAGKRVQVIKKDKGIPTIEFGTEIVTSEDGSLAAVAGASPGASVSVDIMIKLIEKCFKDKYFYPDWNVKINDIIKSNEIELHKNVKLFKEIEKFTSEYLD